ncbi:MAG: ZIP zinc transporter-domain-containing protein [Benjaminiella poitrasii]|nr:MAG: ZIP zinc transporter-domain-containing protein [Benjaminiella poitrasii]
MASKSVISKTCILLLLLAIFLIPAIHAQEHVHEDGTVHNPAEDSDHVHEADTAGIASTNSTTTAIEAEHDHAAETASTESEHSHSHGLGCEIETYTNYNMPLRIGSVFIILATSAVGIFAPIILCRIKPYKEGSFRDWTLTAGKFFGTGVIIATAFIHMLPEALERFSSECIGEGWHSYHAFGGVFCMIASFFLQIVELAALSNLDSIAQKNANAVVGNAEETADRSVIEKQLSVDPQSKVSHIEQNPYEHNHHGIHEDGHVHSAGFLEHEQSVRNIGTFILELGIVMHSIIIGITLGTADGDSFVTLLIALVFHQFFEGIALGTRVNDLNCKTWKKPIIMGLLFICMTPIGIGIGIGIRSSVDPPAAILAQAILDSLSAGVLLYSAYVSLMSIEINHNVGFRRSPLSRKVFCFMCMYIGAALMAVLGTWA